MVGIYSPACAAVASEMHAPQVRVGHRWLTNLAPITRHQIDDAGREPRFLEQSHQPEG